MASIGQFVDDKYEILKLIGKGGMSFVYLAMDKRLNKQWAVKEIPKKARDKNNEVVIQSAIAEANMIKTLDHPSLPRIVDIIDEGDVLYIIMDYIEGESLKTVVDEYGAQPQELVIEWAKQLCGVLDYLHTRKSPIIYRDMKPANIMLKPDGNLVLIDFGIAREYKEHNIADTVCLGTRGYAAPEQYGNRGQTDPRTDVYCLGVTLYHLLTGHNPSEPPYEIYPIRHWNPSLSTGLEMIIQKCTQQNPEDRYQSCAELIYALQHYQEHDYQYKEKQKNKLKKFIVIASISVLCGLVGITGLCMRTHTNNSDYNQNVLLAQNAPNPQNKIDYYVKAIDIKPLEKEAYIGMINAFKEDDNATFTTEEEEIFRKKIDANLSQLKENDGYAELAFEIGKLYWYYYDYGKDNAEDNQITRMKSAIQWFDDAVNYGESSDSFYNMSGVYRDIGSFNRDITLDIEEASDKSKYAPYWENIKNLLTVVSENENEGEIVKLEVYKLTVNAIDTYARKFKADGVEQADMSAVLRQVKSATEVLQTNSDKTQKIKDSLSARFDSAQEAIDNAYRE